MKRTLHGRALVEGRGLGRAIHIEVVQLHQARSGPAGAPATGAIDVPGGNHRSLQGLLGCERQEWHVAVGRSSQRGGNRPTSIDRTDRVAIAEPAQGAEFDRDPGRMSRELSRARIVAEESVGGTD